MECGPSSVRCADAVKSGLLQVVIERAPIYSILVKSAAFTILLLAFDVVEEEVVGMFKGKAFGRNRFDALTCVR